MKREKDYLTKNLLSEEPPKPGHKGYLEPGFHFDDNGNIVDENGNIYYEDYTLKKELPFYETEEGKKAMEMAKRLDSRSSDEELRPLALFYYKRIMAQKRREEKKLKKEAKKNKK